MTKAIKLTLGAFSIWPIIYMVIFMTFTFTMAFHAPAQTNDSSSFDFFKLLFIAHFITMIEIFALIVIYIVYIFKTDRVAQDKKALWAVVIFLGNMIAMPIFWFLYIWKEPKQLNKDNN